MIKRENDRVLNYSPYILDILILVIGISFFFLAFGIKTFPDQNLKGGFFLLSIPTIGIGYMRLMSRLDLNVACLVEGGVALVIPLLFISVFLIDSRGGVIRYSVLFLIIIVGLFSLLIGIYGYFKFKNGKVRLGKGIKVALILTLVLNFFLAFNLTYPRV